MTRTELLTELRRIVGSFRARGKHHSAAQWQRVVDRVNGRKTISDAELAQWRDKAVAKGWKTGAEWLPKAIAWLATVAEAEDAGETEDEIDELCKLPSSYDAMDEPTLRGYLGVCGRSNFPLAKSRIEAELSERAADASDERREQVNEALEEIKELDAEAVEADPALNENSYFVKQVIESWRYVLDNGDVEELLPKLRLEVLEKAHADSRAAIREKLNEIDPNTSKWFPGYVDDVAWKDSDTFGKGKSGANIKFVSAGGYREYTMALEREKDEMGNRGKAIAGSVQNQLASEMYYLKGTSTRGACYGGEKTRREIQRKHGLPCWGSLNAEAHDAFNKELNLIRSELMKASWAAFREEHGLAGAEHDDDWYEDPRWDGWEGRDHAGAFNDLMNANIGHISGGRSFFNDWMGGLRDEFLMAAGGEYHDRILALEAHLPLRYFMENGLEPPAPPAKERTADDIREDMADAQAAGDWDALVRLAAEMKALQA